MTHVQPPGWSARLRGWAKNLKRDVHAIYLAARDRRTPWYAKALAFIVAAYALSPIDLIPDFIPVIGYLDDLILVPLGIFLVIRTIPPHIMAECRQKATIAGTRPISRGAVVIVVVLWIITAAIALRYILSSQ
ncbi:YkvA family protein [Phyllobacterium sp. LjRoot231]|uniref:YkvA family protein n=1 Tax=Phyllobacterium sp. LjRoot231 TaxID=3342289 RepID=UPI003ECCDAE2